MKNIPQAYRGFGQPMEIYQGYGNLGRRYRSRRSHMMGSYGQEPTGVGVECIGDPPAPGWMCDEFVVDERFETEAEADTAASTIFEHLIATGYLVREHTHLSSVNVVRAEDGWTVMVRYWASPEAIAEHEEAKKAEWWGKYKWWVIGGGAVAVVATGGLVWYFWRR